MEMVEAEAKRATASARRGSSPARFRMIIDKLARRAACTCSWSVRAYSTVRRQLRNRSSKAFADPVQEQRPPLQVEGRTYQRDDYSNATPTILSKVGKNLHLKENHPLAILRERIEAHFPNFEHLNSLSPVVTVQQNFDDLGFAHDHPGRSLTDSYYLNKETMLRTHTSAHEVELFNKGINQFLLTADVYRRDEIDRSHYPVFHQMEGANVTTRGEGLARLERENKEMEAHLASANIIITDPTRTTTISNPIQGEHTVEEARIISDHLKNSLNSLVLRLFGGLRKEGDDEPLQVRWIEATFPWTAPSYEVEVLYDGKWLEILGCGVVKQDALKRSGVYFLTRSPVTHAQS